MLTGVYSISTPSGKRYIGSSADIEKRWKIHLRELKKGTHHNKPLNDAFAKYGESGFSFSIILLCDASELLAKEQQAIDAESPEYNLCPVAGSRLGAKLTDAHKEQISAVHKGKSISESHKMAISNRHKGKVVSDETRRKLSEAAKRRVIPEAQRAKMTANRIAHYEAKKNAI